MLALLLLLGSAVAQNVPRVDPCDCGYYDATIGHTFTESIIVYFNESTAVAEDVWSVQEYVHKKEKGYSSLYRQGARPENVRIGNDSTVPWLQNELNPNSLQLFVDPASEDHLVNGGGIQSRRQDIQYGSFRASLRSPHPWRGGSALSMMVMFNESQSLELDMLNADNADDARLTYLVNGEYPSQQLSTNYSLIEQELTSPISPWDFTDVRIDWFEDAVIFTVADNATRTITSRNTGIPRTPAEVATRVITSSERAIPRTPSEVIFKHWSTGDENFMGGPPTNLSPANVAWVRLFFNSSLMSTEEHEELDTRCRSAKICDMNDMTLRGSSPYAQRALNPFKEPPRDVILRIPAAIAAAACAFCGFITLTNAFITKGPWRKVAQLFKRKSSASPSEKQADTPLDTTTASDLLKEGFSLQPSSSASKEDSSSVSICSHSDIDPFKSSDPTRVSSEVEFNIDLTETGEAKTSILDGGQSTYSAHFGVLVRNDSMRRERASLAKNRASLAHRRTSLNERRALIEDADQKTTNGRRPFFGERIGTSVERRASQLRERRMSNEEWKASNEERKVSLEEQAMSGLISRIETQRRRKSSAADCPVLGLQRCNSTNVIVSKTAKENTTGEAATRENNLRDYELIEKPAAVMVPDRRENEKRVLSKIEQPSLVNPGYTMRRDKLEQSGNMSVAASKAIAPVTSPRQRVDYLAGLVALSCIAVTFVHFTLTFIPYVGGLGYGQHYSYEEWGRNIAGPYILTPIWIGPFFTTSSRFLAARYLTEGKLSDIANKMFVRAPRMLIPVFIIAMLEYFLIDQGLTGALQYLPSISWSTWPYVTNYPNFGYYINNMIELAFLIPNAAPQVVAHFCVGVLWTIPVQLQNSYLVLLAVVMIRDIKTPWKRFSFYTFCIVNHWYAFSWGSCFWLGLVLADLDVTYKWIKWIQARPFVHYPFLLLMWLITIAAPTFFLIQDRLNYNIMSVEKGWHPDPETGLPMAQTPRARFPNYYDPRLNTLMFAGALQVIVELSTWVQWFLSLPVFIWIFPHIMTIYLIHGFVFWSLGAWLCITLSVIGLPYWANMLVVVVVCYAVLLMVSVLITLVTEKTAQAACRNSWRWASEEPVPKLTTLFPYPKDQFLNRSKEDRRVSGDLEDLSAGKGKRKSKDLDANITEDHSRESLDMSTTVHDTDTLVHDTDTLVNSWDISDHTLPAMLNDGRQKSRALPVSNRSSYSVRPSHEKIEWADERYEDKMQREGRIGRERERGEDGDREQGTAPPFRAEASSSSEGESSQQQSHQHMEIAPQSALRRRDVAVPSTFAPVRPLMTEPVAPLTSDAFIDSFSLRRHLVRR